MQELKYFAIIVVAFVVWTVIQDLIGFRLERNQNDVWNSRPTGDDPHAHAARAAMWGHQEDQRPLDFDRAYADGLDHRPARDPGEGDEGPQFPHGRLS